MTTFFNITIPYNGNFSQPANAAGRTHDLIPLTTNRWISAFAQKSQAIVYLNIIDFADFANSSTYTNTKTLFITPLPNSSIAGIYLIKITDERVALFVERDVYIVDIIGSNIEVILHEPNFFVRGALNNVNTAYDSTNGDTGRGYGECFYARSFKNNEFFVMDQEDSATATGNTNSMGNFASYAFRFMHIVYDPITNTLTNNSRRLFVAADSDTPPAAGYMFKLHITNIPDSNKLYMSFNISRSNSSTTSFSYLYPVYFYSAIIDDAGIVQSIKTYPNVDLNFISWNGTQLSQQKTNPTASVALSENLIMWHPQHLTSLVMEYNGDFTNIVNPGGLDPAYSKCTDIIPLDAGHYIMRWVEPDSLGKISNERIYVIRLINNQFIQFGNAIEPATNTIQNTFSYNPRKYQMYKLSNTMFALFSGVSNGFSSVTYQLARIKI